MGLRRTALFAAEPWRSLVILSLYGYQGLVAGFALNALPNLHAAQGASVSAIGFYVALVGLPWTLQPLWGPVVDRFGAFRMGRRRAWIIGGLCAALLCLGLLAAAGGTASLARLGVLMMLHSVFAALVDTAVDGMIIDHVPAEALGRATASTRIGFACGTALGAALFAWAIPALGLSAAALLMLAMGVACALAPLLVREAASDAWVSLRLRATAAGEAQPAVAGRGAMARMAGDLFAALRRRESLMLVALCLSLEFVVGAFGVGLVVSMVQDGGWDPGTVSRLQGLLAMLGGTVGAVAVGWWSDRVGHLRALAALLALCSTTHLAAAVLLAGDDALGVRAGWALALSALAPALVFVALAPAVMLASRGSAAATRFTIYMAAVNLGGVSGAAASGPVGTVLGAWQLAFLASLVFAAGSLAVRWPALFLGVAASSKHLSGARNPMQAAPAERPRDVLRNT